jgi:hypothetical protein
MDGRMIVASHWRFLILRTLKSTRDAALGLGVAAIVVEDQGSF